MIFLIILSLFSTCQSISYESLLQEEWSAFKIGFNKTYRTNEEESFRREIFFENRHKIAMSNIDFGRGIQSFSQGINSFADLLNHEFSFLLNGYNRTARLELEQTGVVTQRVPKNIRPSNFIRPINTALPDYWDWRQYGAVSPVRFQGICASCWAFSATGALEGHYFRKNGILQVLSPQNLVDCSHPQGNSGCMGGLMDNAYEYVKDNFGINSEGTYPYEMKDNVCRFQPDDRAAECTGYVELNEGDEEALKEAVATLGPVSVVIDAGQDSFQFYKEGLYFEPNCESASEKMNHGVLVVGYGSDNIGQDYWIVKNSYGTNWGQGGYINMARNRNNHCGIATFATYPLIP